MKTSSVVNLRQIAGAILMVVALVTSSCNKNLDDGKSTKETNYQTIEGLTRLIIDISDLRASIISTQTTIVTLPETSSIKSLKTGMTDISSRIDGLSSTLQTMSNQGVSNALIEGLKNDLLMLLAKVATDNDALRTRMNVIGTTDDIYSAKLNALMKTNTSLMALILSSQKSADNLINFTGYTQMKLVVDIQKVQIAAAQSSFGILLALYMP